MKTQVAAWGRRALAGAHAAAAWWLAELAALVPPRVGRWLLGDGEVIRIRFGDGQIRLDIAGEGALAWPVEDARHTIEPRLRRRIARAQTLALMLPAASVLRRVVPAPEAASRQLHAAVPFLLERYTPFRQAHARAAWRIVDRNAAAKTILLELAVTAASPLMQSVAALHATGIPISSIRIEGDERAPALDFWAQSRFGRARFRMREPARLMLAAALVLLLFGPPVVAVITHVQAARMEASLAAIGGRQGGRAALDRLREQQAQSARLSPRLATPSALATLDALSRVLSDDTWLFGVELSGHVLELQGFSGNLPAAVAQLQSLPETERLEFRSPVMHGIHDNKDRFDILLRLKNGDHAQLLPAQPNGSFAAVAGGDVVGMGIR